MKFSRAFVLVVILPFSVFAQTIELSDDFESGSDGLTWSADDIGLNTETANPFPGDGNPSATVMLYEDFGAQFGNVYSDMPVNIDLTENSTFTVKVYVPSESLTGEQPNQVSLKLQNANLVQPWSTQTEIIKSISLDQWQVLTFDFSTDEYINNNGSSPAPTERFDLNRLLFQVNGEFNSDLVVAYFDDFSYDGVLDPDANPSNSIYNTLVWSDEFEIDGPVNSEKWFHQTLLPNGIGWFNNEQQHYTDRIENSYVEDGSLHIVAKREVFMDQSVMKQFTSARLNSKFAFTYGRVVARAKLPTGVGTWPAIWMLGKNITENGGYWAEEYGTTGWPACGEIDIMEHWGNNQNVVSSALHTPSSSGATENYGTITDEDVSEEFHIYEMEWSPNAIVFSLDGTVFYVYAPGNQNPDTWPFTEDQYLLLNIAIEAFVSDAFQESDMELDYIRVYQEGAPTSTNDLEEVELQVYPNPAKDQLIVQSPRSDNSALIEIYSITGVKLLTRNTTGTKSIISINELPAGSYVVTYRSQEALGSVPFIKID